MKIYNKIVVSMITGEILEEDCFDYDGPLAMARGEQKKALDQTEYQAAQERQAADAYRDQLQQEQDANRSQLLEQYKDLYDHPLSADEQAMYNTPISPEESAAQRATATGPFEAAKTRAEHLAGTSSNLAGLNEAEDELARNSSQALSQTEASLSNEAYQRKMALDQVATQKKLAALSAMSNLYGVDAGTLAHAMGMPAQYLDIYGRAAGTPRQGGFVDAFDKSFGNALGNSLGTFGFGWSSGPWSVKG